jgi:hypothetical protein
MKIRGPLIAEGATNTSQAWNIANVPNA